MPISVQITVRDMAHSEALDARIREKVAALERSHPRITSCRVVVSEIGKHRSQGRRFEVSIDVRAPGHVEVVSDRHHDEDVCVALRDAFDSATRQIEELARQKRGETKG